MAQVHKKIACKVFVAIVSFVCSVIFLVFLTNAYLVLTKKDVSAVFSEWTLLGAHYSSQYVYWGKSYCEENPGDCKKAEEHVTSSKVLYINQADTDQSCERYVFLGDSFTIAPWVEIEKSWMYAFLLHYAQKRNTCVMFMSLATGGSGNDQQLARFIDVVGVLNPDVVVWQFYWNDLNENFTQEIFKVHNSTLKRQQAYFNPKFIAGYINQNISLVQQSAFGKYLMHIAENLYVGPWFSINLNDEREALAHNTEKIPLLLDKMKQLSKEHSFSLVETLAPLECQHTKMR
jgi:hypothetical protein